MFYNDTCAFDDGISTQNAFDFYDVGVSGSMNHSFFRAHGKPAFQILLYALTNASAKRAV